MKNISKIIASLVIVLLTTVSCEQFSEISEIEKVETLKANVSVTLDLGDAPVPSSLNVRFINYEERYELTTSMNPDGTIVVDDIIPGIYTITISSEAFAEGFTYNYSGSLVNVDIVSNNLNLNVDVQASKAGALLFKEVYYCGSRTPTGGVYFRDQFYEIYNNSDVQQNVRGLAIAQLNPMTATANIPEYDIPNPDDFVYALTIWQVPDDKDYPLEPGESVIIAQMADDHTKENLNPNAPVNLLSAEFETYVRSSSFVQDNPAINMEIAFWPRVLPQWLTTVFGSAFVIYFPEEPIDPAGSITPIGSSREVYQIPIDLVVDALELVGNPNHVQLKRMPTVLDAGAATVGGTYASLSVARKVKETKDGRAVLMDTNNSSDDFEVMDPPMIRRYGAEAPSWNTWK
jgi:hypothetical protein